MNSPEEVVERLLSTKCRIGLDIGSRSTKAAFMDGDDIGLAICDTPPFLEKLRGSDVSGIDDIVISGYGRKRIRNARSIPEIRAHTTGVIRSLDIDRCTILDIGGQDFKVIRIENRSIRDFKMNDKCAAGTGRFLEKMASMLSLEIEELGMHEGSTQILESTCSVFTETEIISHMMEGMGVDELASGVIHSVYERIRPYLKMFPTETIVFTGGVSNMNGLGRTISKELDTEVVVPENSQFMGALGCYHARIRKV